MLALDGADLDRMHMPNVPKMSRRKSDSGIDVFDITLDDLASPGDDLGAGDRLVVVSVKHSVDEASVGGLRWKLVDSLSGRELTRAYMAAQLRVLHGRLCQEGMTGDVAERVYLFLRDFPDPMLVKMVAVGVVDVAAEDAIRHHVALLSPVSGAEHVFRAVLLPGLDELHTRCP